MAFFKPRQAHNASRSQPESPSKRWLREHKEVVVSSWGQLWQTPFANLLTWLTLAIALTLPAGLLLLLSQAQHPSLIHNVRSRRPTLCSTCGSPYHQK